MNRLLRALLALVLVSIVLSNSLTSAIAESSNKPPNIVLLLTDDHPWNEYGFMGSDVAHTPNIDKFASKSARFVNGYVPSSVCRPSLGVMLTGRYPHESGIWFNRSPNKNRDRNAANLIQQNPSLPRILGEHGYASLQTGKHWEGSYNEAGFDEGTTVYEEDDIPWNGTVRNGPKIGRDTLEPIFDFVNRQTSAERPFFLWYGVYLPHAPTDAPAEFQEPFAGKGLKDYEVAYHANIARLDDSIGRLMDFFDEKELLEETLFVLVSDNGMKIHQDPWWGGAGGKTSTGELGLRTPILVRWDGQIEPATHRELVSTIDFVPTVLDAAGINHEQWEFAGENWLDIAKNPDEFKDRAVFGELYNPNPTKEVTGPPEETVSYRWVRQKNWKLIEPENLDRRDLLHKNWPKITGVKAADHFTKPRLFNLAEDPEERNDLAQEKPEIRERLLAALNTWWNPAVQTTAKMKPNKPDQPNVLFIAIDDLNDWVGCLGGHPDARTPHIDRLAARGTLFTNAHTAAPVCNPSRAAFLSGLGPFTTGIYHNGDNWTASEVMRGVETLPGHFRNNGYRTLVGGKIFHTRPDLSEALDENAGQFGGQTFQIKAEDFPDPFQDVKGIHNFALHWGGLKPEAAEKLSDPKIADWAAEHLGQKHDQPFMLMVGFHRPHTPLTSPDTFHRMFDRDKLALPPIHPSDLNDLPWMGRQVAIAGYQAMEQGHYKNIVERGYHRDVVHGYLAACTFVDAQVGKVLDALDTSPYRDNTIVVLFSDHGWGLGERYHFKKWGLWEDTTHVPLIVHVPWMSEAGSQTDAGVMLLDLFPTLTDLCELAVPPQGFDGKSLKPLLRNPRSEWERPALTTFGQENYALRTPRWRYIRWSDGSAELYDHENDPHEWTNLASEEEFQSVIQELDKWLPKTSVPSVRSDFTSPVRLTKGEERTFRSVRPTFAGQPITIEATIGPHVSDGVLLSHGSQFCGYSLTIKDGKLSMSVMDVPRPLQWDQLKPTRTIVTADEPLESGSKLKVVGMLKQDGTILLKENGRTIAEGKANPLSIHPAGPMQCGEAPTSYVAVGSYKPPFKYTGDLKEVIVSFGNANETE